MSRSGAVTFKGAPLTLAGEELRAGQPAPDFTLHYFDGGMKTISLADLKGKPTLLSVVPSLDTGVCADQTRHFNERLAALGDRVSALTVSCDLPFAQGRFCSDNGIARMRVGSDYMTREFGRRWGLLIEELQLLARGVFVLDRDGKVLHAQVCPEVASEPDYDAALDALENAA